MRIKFDKAKYELGLQPADKYVVVNDGDPDLHKWRFRLPKPPDYEDIDGYGLDPVLQKFVRQEFPRRLRRLIRECISILEKKELENRQNKVTEQKILALVWDDLERLQGDYNTEIVWIKTQWYRIINGYWLFIKGKPTYIDGWHYAYLNFWNLDVGLPEYRDRDRRWFHIVRYLYTTKQTIKYHQRVDHRGNTVYDTVLDDEGFPILEETGNRTFYGFMYPKHRRDGATHKCLNILYFISIVGIGSTTGGIQSYSGTNAEEHFTKKLIPAWRKMPFFFRPIWKGNDRPAKVLDFTSPPSMRASLELERKIDFAETASRSAYDGEKLHAYLGDEAGKTKVEDILERHNVVKLTASQGAGAVITGLLMYPSTVADMESGGGEPYYKLSVFSDFTKRNPVTGQTMSGLARIFMPAYDGLEGFIGEYGESIIGTPTKEQAKFIGKQYGAKYHIESTLNTYVADGSADAMIEYYTFKALHPTTYADCFRVSDGNIGFNIAQLDRGISYSRRNKHRVLRGKFEWEGGIIDGKVSFHENPLGDWEISYQMPSGMSNRRVKLRDTPFGECWIPEFMGKFTAGQDPIKFHTKSEARIFDESTRRSKGAGVVFRHRDKSIDDDNKPVEDWETHCFVAIYLKRIDDDDLYAEEQLKACVYFGAMAFPETNLAIVVKHFIKRGYAGYLKYYIDENTKRMPNMPGAYAGTANKEELMSSIGKWINYHAHRCLHEDLLVQMKQIRGSEEMTKYDLIAAAGWALYSLDSYHGQDVVENSSIDIDLEDYIKSYN